MTPPIPVFIWVYEDQLPDDIDGQVYDWLFPLSAVVEGVRMMPWPIVKLASLKCSGLINEDEEKEIT